MYLLLELNYLPCPLPILTVQDFFKFWLENCNVGREEIRACPSASSLHFPRCQAEAHLLHSYASTLSR